MPTNTRLYCPNCKQHTNHRHHVSMFATQCDVCHTLTSQLERLHVQDLRYTAPDGTEAEVVENTPDRVTFYVGSGNHKGYYYYDKHTKQKRIVALS